MSEGGALDTANYRLPWWSGCCLFVYSLASAFAKKCLNIKFWHLLATTASVLFLFIVGGISGVDFNMNFRQFIVMLDFVLFCSSIALLYRILC